jgi:hypothetical protein
MLHNKKFKLAGDDSEYTFTVVKELAFPLFELMDYRYAIFNSDITKLEIFKDIFPNSSVFSINQRGVYEHYFRIPFGNNEESLALLELMVIPL